MRLAARQLGLWFRCVLIGTILLAVGGCAAVYRNHGYVPSEENLAKIKVGVDTRDSVAQAVGTPSSSGVLNDGGYYYVATRMRLYGLLKPQVVERQLVAISFDGRGVVRNVERFGLEDGRVIPLDHRVTDSGSSGPTFLRQLLGNLTNFSSGNFLQP